MRKLNLCLPSHSKKPGQARNTRQAQIILASLPAQLGSQALQQLLAGPSSWSLPPGTENPAQLGYQPWHHVLATNSGRPLLASAAWPWPRLAVTLHACQLANEEGRPSQQNTCLCKHQFTTSNFKISIVKSIPGPSHQHGMLPVCPNHSKLSTACMSIACPTNSP